MRAQITGDRGVEIGVWPINQEIMMAEAAEAG